MSSNKCPYCGEEIEDENDRGVHISENHVDEDEDIVRKKRSDSKKKSLLKDSWDKDEG